MTQFKCDRCGKVDELDKALVDITDEGKQTYICEECDKASRTTMSFVECAWCGEYVDESELEEVYDDEEGREVMICKKCFRDLIVPSGDTCVCCGEIIPEGRQVCLMCDLEARYGSEPIIEKKDAPADTGTLKHPFDIHKIIDDAMEKRDRTVSIYIGEHGTSISVSPHEDEKVRWIYYGYESDSFYSCHYQCSNCGVRNQIPTTYCPSCGELMHGIKEVLGDEEET